MNTTLTMGLIGMICIQVIMFFMQVAVTDIGSNNVFFNGEGIIACQREVEGCANYSTREFTPVSDTYDEDFPSGEGGVSPDTGNLFTDVFTSIRGFFMNTLGLKYVVSFLTAPFSILNAMGLPSVFVAVVGGAWYVIYFFLLVAFLWGRDA